MKKRRVHELAKELGLENKDALMALQKAGIAVKTHSSSVGEDEAMAVLNKLKNDSQEKETAARRPGMMIIKKRRDAATFGDSDEKTEMPPDAVAPPSDPESAQPSLISEDKKLLSTAHQETKPSKAHEKPKKGGNQKYSPRAEKSPFVPATIISMPYRAPVASKDVPTSAGHSAKKGNPRTPEHAAKALGPKSPASAQESQPLQDTQHPESSASSEESLAKSLPAQTAQKADDHPTRETTAPFHKNHNKLPPQSSSKPPHGANANQTGNTYSASARRQHTPNNHSSGTTPRDRNSNPNQRQQGQHPQYSRNGDSSSPRTGSPSGGNRYNAPHHRSHQGGPRGTASGHPGQRSNHPSSRTTGSTPGTGPHKPAAPVATVVRMIDRDKLMERVPNRRLGGPGGQNRGNYSGGGNRPAGAGGHHPRSGGQPRPGGGGRPAGSYGPPQHNAPGSTGPHAGRPPRYGQVTELKVVTDPFGRNREMVAVNRDKKAKSHAGGGHAQTKQGQNARRSARPAHKRDMADVRERALHPARLKKKKSGTSTDKAIVHTSKAQKRVVKMKEHITVFELAKQLGVKSSELLRKLMALGVMATQNQNIDFDTAQLLATDFDYTIDSIAFSEDKHIQAHSDAESAADLKPRAPVVTIMGHVDHGKTSLLDTIRKARVAQGEAGGITQHIGAYSVDVKRDEGPLGKVTFLDTPGHAAFTAMRARGAQATDIVVLVVAGDDGVMPQTEEAIQHAQAAKVPIIVAINKMDKPDVQPDRVMQELTKFSLVPEAWGGETIYVHTSATTGMGVDQLLESILLQAEVLELKANPTRAALGTVIEAKLDKGRGPVATLLVQQGTLKRGDAVVVGLAHGKIRAMMNDIGKNVTEAGPSVPVEITGLDIVPNAGDAMSVVESLEVAREIIAHRQQTHKESNTSTPAISSLDELMKKTGEQQQSKELKIVLKGDVQGSVEALKGALTQLSTPDVRVNIVYGGVGGIKESDIMLASASQGLVIGFAVRPDANARQMAERNGVDIRVYQIIYEAVDDVRRAMEGLLGTESREKVLGRAQVREIFKVSKVGTIAGCRVTEGKANRAYRVRVIRDSVQVYEGKVASLKHFKNDVREVESGLECGIGIEAFNDVKAQDVLEFYMIEEIARSLEPNSSDTTPRHVEAKS